MNLLQVANNLLKKLFVKGKHVWVYAVGIIDGDNEEE